MVRARRLFHRRSERRSVDPGGERAPGRITLRRKLPSAGVKHSAATFGGKRMQQPPAGIGIAGIDQDRDGFEIATRLFLGPVARALCKLFQMEGVVALDMTDIATRMVGPLGQKDWLDPDFEKLVVEFRRGLRWGH